jgi:uncharacterized protein (TIGR03437 family)
MIMAPEFLPVVRVGGIQAEVNFTGAVPGVPGLNQISFKVPAQSPPGLLSLSVQVGASVSNAAVLPVGKAR